MKGKSLYDISWKVTEEEYRADSALSYSTLSRFEREGFNNLDKLFDKVESPSLTFGSAVDAIITGGQEEFDSRFIVAEFPILPDSIIAVVKTIFENCSDNFNNINDIDDKYIIAATELHHYQLNWKPETRAKVIKEKGFEYYNLLFISEDKIIVSTQLYQEICATVDILKNSQTTSYYFASNNPFEPDIERLYQLKFKATLNGINYRCMMDEVIIDYEHKTIQPIDLKTTSKPEWDFYKSFVEWNYQIQNRLYYRILQDNIKKDPYFKDFKILPYQDIVVNRKTLTPLVWECPFTFAKGTLLFGKNDQIIMKDPEDIGKELTYYLESKPLVPKSINNTGSNNLINWLNTL